MHICRTWRASVLLALAVTAPAAAAQDEDSPIVIAAHWFDRGDLNKDGYVDVAELQSGRMKQFRRMDGNGDGQIDLDEYRYGIPSHRAAEMALMERQFSLADGNGDGTLTSDEFVAYAQVLVAGGDGDGDGRLSLEEFTATFLGE
jgi:EF hand